MNIKDALSVTPETIPEDQSMGIRQMIIQTIVYAGIMFCIFVALATCASTMNGYQRPFVQIGDVR